MKINDLKDGMILTLRDKTKVIMVGELFIGKCGNIITNLNEYNNDLTHKCSKKNDIIKIEYSGDVLWKEQIDWTKVPFGTEVVGWWKGDDKKYVGRLLAFDKDGEELQFFIFIEHANDTNWFDYCELL